MIVGVGELQALGIQARSVRGEGVAAAGVVGLDGLVGGGEGDDLVLQVVGSEVVGEVELGGGALLRADRSAVELQRRVHAQLLADHEALAVIVVDAGEGDAERGVAGHRPGRVADQQVDFARLQRSEAVLGGKRDELDLARIVEDRRGDRAAIVDVEARPVTLRVRHAETGEAGVRAAVQDAALLDLRERRLRRCTRGGNRKTGRSEEAGCQNFLHHYSPIETSAPDKPGKRVNPVRRRRLPTAPSFPAMKTASPWPSRLPERPMSVKQRPSAETASCSPHSSHASLPEWSSLAAACPAPVPPVP